MGESDSNAYPEALPADDIKNCLAVLNILDEMPPNIHDTSLSVNHTNLEVFKTGTDALSHSFISEMTEQSNHTGRRSELLPKRFDFYTFACILSDIYGRFDLDVEIGNNGLVETAAAFLGRGAFSSVYLMQPALSENRNDRHSAATKFTSPSIIRVGQSYDNTARDFFQQAITELRILSHSAINKSDKIVNLRAIHWDTGPDAKGTTLWEYIWPALCLEVAHCGSLQQLQAANDDLGEALKFSLCFDIAAGIDFLHSCGITHGDIKAENVLIFQSATKRLTAKLADFGSSLINEGESWMLDGGTDPWVAPEWGQTVQLFEMTTLTDNYSFGLLVLRMYIGGQNPFSFMDLSSVSRDTLSDDSILSFKRKNLVISQAQDLLGNINLSNLYSASVRSILERTLDADPHNRAYELSSLFLEQDSSLSEMERNEFKKSQASNPPIKIPFVTRCPSIENLRRFRQERPISGALDIRVRRQIFECLQENEKEWSSLENNQLSGQLQYEIALCYLYGFGTAPCIDSALRSLVQSAENGYEDAVILVSQACSAYSRPVPEGFNLSDLVTRLNSVGAVELRTCVRDRYQQLLRDTVDVAAISQSNGPKEKLSVQLPRMFPDCSSNQLQALNDMLISSTGLSLAHWAVACNAKVQLISLLDNLNLDVNAVDKQISTLILTGSLYGNHEAVYTLLSRRANVNLANTSGMTCLHFLPAFGKDQIHRIGHALVNNGADLEAMDSMKRTPLMTAIYDNCLESVAVLLKLGAEVSKHSLIVATSTVSGRILDLLFRELRDRDQRPSWEQLRLSLRAFSTARSVGSMVRHGKNLRENVSLSFEIMAKYMKLWCSPKELEEKTKEDSTTLERMIRNIGDFEIVIPALEMYFMHFMDSTTLSQMLSGSLMVGNQPVFSKLLELGVIMDIGSAKFVVTLDEPYFIEQLAARAVRDDIDGASLFQLAVASGCYKTASWLLQNKFLTYRSRFFMSDLLLSLTTRLNLAPIVYLAENFDASDFYPNGNADEEMPPTILHYLAIQQPRQRHDTLVVKMHAYILQKWRGFVNTATGVEQSTPLIAAARSRNLPFLSLLLENGADVNATDAAGWTVMDKVLFQRITEVWESHEGGEVPEGLTHFTDWRVVIRRNYERIYSEDPDSALSCAYLLQDNWLNKMYAAIVKAGGKSTHWESLGWGIPEDLSNWSKIVVDKKRTYIERCREERKDVGFKSL